MLCVCRYVSSYDDFSVPTFDTQHNLIKGGSWSSTGNEAHRLSRYAFRRHFYQHAGFRYVETDRVVTIRTNAYERDDALSMYMDAHFSKDAESTSRCCCCFDRGLLSFCCTCL